MKPCEFAGWVELEDNDKMKCGDPMVSQDGTPDTPYDYIKGYHNHKKSEVGSHTRVFRMDPMAKSVRSKRPLNKAFSTPLPLP